MTKTQPEALRFTKKPVVIEAFQMTEERRASNADWPKASSGPQPEERQAFYRQVQALLDAEAGVRPSL